MNNFKETLHTRINFFGVLNDDLLETIIQEIIALYKVFGPKNDAFC